MNSLLFVTFSESDKKLLIIAIVFLVVLLLLLGLIGMAIRQLTASFGKQIDNEIHDVVVYRIIDNPKDLFRYGMIKNNRRFVKESLPAFLIFLVSIILYITYSAITGMWHEDFLGHFSSLLWTWDWNDPSIWSNFWGLTLLSNWPPLASSPHWVNEYWASYLLVPLWTISIVYFAITVQAWIGRLILLRRRTKTVFQKTLEGFNFYDEKKAEGTPSASKSQNEKEKNS